MLGANGIPAITVPDGSSKDAAKLVGPVSAKLPVGIAFLARPFNEPKLIKMAAAYEAASKHRTAPKGFGRISGEP